MKKISTSVAQTERIAGQLAAAFAPGSCVALVGELGAGKTQFVRGLVKALGGDVRAVSSPTFVLLNIYPTPSLPVYHLDAYRVHGSEDFANIGFAELLEQKGLVVVEWADRVAEILPAERITVQITTTGKRTRMIEW